MKDAFPAEYARCLGEVCLSPSVKAKASEVFRKIGKKHIPLRKVNSWAVCHEEADHVYMRLQRMSVHLSKQLSSGCHLSRTQMPILKGLTVCST